MTTANIILLVIDAILFVALLGYVAFRVIEKKKASKPVAEPVIEQDLEPAIEEQPTVDEQPVVEEQAIPFVEETVATEEIDDLDIERAKRIPFAEKLLSLDAKVQGYYDELNNKFKSLRRINARVSIKGASYRLGRELVAKITVRGKTMKLHLALDVTKFEEKIYFQKDMSDVKAYAEVPFTVKVKSDRGARNAINLINALAEEKSIESKVRYNQVDSIAQLKDIIVASVLAENK